MKLLEGTGDDASARQIIQITLRQQCRFEESLPELRRVNPPRFRALEDSRADKDFVRETSSGGLTKESVPGLPGACYASFGLT